MTARCPRITHRTVPRDFLFVDKIKKKGTRFQEAEFSLSLIEKESTKKTKEKKNKKNKNAEEKKIDAPTIAPGTA